MIPVAVVGDGGGEDMWRLAGVSGLRLVYCTINMGVFSVHRSTCKQTGASERSRVRAEIVYITVSELFWWEDTLTCLDYLGIGQEATYSGPIHHTVTTSLHASYTESSARPRTFNVETQKLEPPTNSIR